MTVQQIQQSAAPGAVAPSAEMDNLHLRESQGGAAPQGVQPQTAQMDTPPVATQQASPRGTQAPILTGAERRLSEHHDYEEGLLRAAHERKQAAEAEAFLAAETKKAQALLARKVADADAEVKLAAAKAAEREAKVQYKMDLKVDKAHEKFEQKAALAVEHAELKKAAVQEEAEEKIVAAMEKAEHVRAGEEVLKPSLAQKIGLKKKEFKGADCAMTRG